MTLRIKSWTEVQFPASEDGWEEYVYNFMNDVKLDDDQVMADLFWKVNSKHIVIKSAESDC